MPTPSAAIPAPGSKLSRQHLEALVHSIDAIVWEADPQDKAFTYISPQIERILGYGPSPWLGDMQNWAACIHPDDRASTLQKRRWAITQARDYTLEYRLLAAGGRPVWVRDLVAVVQTEGEVTAWRGLMVDITEAKRLEEQGRQIHKMQAVGQLTMGIAHNFNNLLQIVTGNISLGLDEVPPQLRSHCQDALAAVERAASLVRRLVICTAPLQRSVQYETIDLERLVDSVLGRCRRHWAAGTACHVDLAPGLSVEGDAQQLPQALFQLVLNAAEALDRARSSTPWIGIEAQAYTDGLGVLSGPCVRLRVRDNGKGIAAADRPYLFDPFFSTKRGGLGTGLGLSTALGIACQHGGWIVCEAPADQTTAFSMYLPAPPLPDGGH